MKKQQSGFTLIELIAVIVILGILAATAVPRFVNLTAAAGNAAVEGVAGALGSASALNHAANIATDAGVTGAPAPTATTNCTAIGPLLNPALAAPYSIATLAIGTNEGDTVACTAQYDLDEDGTFEAGEPSATFTAYNVQ